MPSNTFKINPKLDLVLERVVDVPKELVWKAWTTPKHILKWFTPSPWKTIECEIDLRPGGKFYTVMQSPEGQNFPNAGCFLEIVPNKKLVWTAALQPGYRPVKNPENGAGLLFTAVIALESKGKGTKYTATVIHGNEDDMKRHDAMGFRDGWGKALDQLVALIKNKFK
jgi:uncharacterized protein YndB with AHSA1/START domain